MAYEDDTTRGVAVVVGHHHQSHQHHQPAPPPPEERRNMAYGYEDDKTRGEAVVVDHHHRSHHHHQPQPPPPPPQYGTFQGVANSPPPPAMGFPQPAPPPGAHGSSTQYYTHGYQTVPGYAVAEGTPVRDGRLPCCGIGLGWFLFITGFFFGAIPWYAALFFLMCGHIDHREKPGYIACAIAAGLATVAIIFGATKGAEDW